MHSLEFSAKSSTARSVPQILSSRAPVVAKGDDSADRSRPKGSNPPETDDLRNLPIYEAPAGHLAYGHQSPRPKSTSGLPIGTQARFLEAAAIAAAMNRPLDTLLTLRWRSLFSANDPNGR